MERGVLDTSVLIAEDVAALPGQLAISVISIAELHYGVLVASSEPQVRSTNCSPRLNTLVWVQPTGRGVVPAGRVPLTLST